jgi:phosphoribosylformylglycinamidine (FGAM) synthase-like amidotransferase family enzyme
MKTAVIVFPGSNCDRDIAVALEEVTGVKPLMVWHGDADLPADVGLVAVPGGFSYGDYLRFQVLTEAGLLPGALMRNEGLNFVCRDVALTVETAQSRFTSGYKAGERVSFPVAHHDGNYFADTETLDRLEGEGRVAFRYAESVNGSARNIAGLLNDTGNVLGMMPHPERRIEAAHGGTDGRRLFQGLMEAVSA